MDLMWVWFVVFVVVLASASTTWLIRRRNRTQKLRREFGPEYDRTLASTDSRRDAEAELQAREERRQQLEIRPLSEGSRERYVETWRSVQAQFVDDPRQAVAGADSLIQSVMAERGYPVDDFEQRAADVSVDHPHVVENYRRGHALAKASAGGRDSTEDLRQAMKHYRALFDELVEPAAEQPTTREHLGQHDEIRDQPSERTVR